MFLPVPSKYKRKGCLIKGGTQHCSVVQHTPSPVITTPPNGQYGYYTSTILFSATNKFSQ